MRYSPTFCLVPAVRRPYHCTPNHGMLQQDQGFMPPWLPAAFRRSSARIEQLFAAYGEKCEFANIYVSEAHPSDGWSFGADHPEQQAWAGAHTDESKAEYLLRQMCIALLRVRAHVLHTLRI